MMSSIHDEAADRLARKLAGRFKLVNWAWIILSLFLLGSMVGAIAGVWNIYMTIKRWRVAEMIAKRDPRVVAIYENAEGSLITWAAINLILGGVVGAAIIAYEYIMIRGPIMKNRSLFTRTMPRGAF